MKPGPARPRLLAALALAVAMAGAPARLLASDRCPLPPELERTWAALRQSEWPEGFRLLEVQPEPLHWDASCYWLAFETPWGRPFVVALLPLEAKEIGYSATASFSLKCKEPPRPSAGNRLPEVLEGIRAVVAREDHGGIPPPPPSCRQRYLGGAAPASGPDGRRDSGSGPSAAGVADLVAGLGPFSVVRLDASEVVLRLETGDPKTPGILRLHPGGRGRYRFSTRSFGVSIDDNGIDPPTFERLVAAAHAIDARDDGRFRTDRQDSTGAFYGIDFRDAWLLTAATGAAVGAALLLALFRRFRVSLHLRTPHVLPAIIQVSVFAYWSMYWPAVASYLPLLATQLLLAFALEAALSFARFGSWRVGLAPVPIVLSANLFAWFNPAGMVLLVVVAIGTKMLLHRQGRHVLNPSAAGLVVPGLLSIVTPRVHFSGLFHTLSVAPSTSELVVLLALLPQLRFPIVPVSLGALAGLEIMSKAGAPVGNVDRAGTVLAFALLATDPATIPRTPLGRLLFGLFYGLGTGVCVAALRRLGQPDDLGKVAAIPIANLLVPVFDRVGERFRIGALAPRWNPAHVALWVVLMCGHFAREKSWSFPAGLHWSYGTRFVRFGADDVPRCRDNPVFCRPFRVLEEGRLWLGSRTSTGRAASEIPVAGGASARDVPERPFRR